MLFSMIKITLNLFCQLYFQQAVFTLFLRQTLSSYFQFLLNVLKISEVFKTTIIVALSISPLMAFHSPVSFFYFFVSTNLRFLIEILNFKFLQPQSLLFIVFSLSPTEKPSRQLSTFIASQGKFLFLSFLYLIAVSESS